MTSSLQDSVTRNRSNSGEDSELPEHDRKRPRLSEGKSDAEQHLPELNPSPQHSTLPYSTTTPLGAAEVCPRPALPPRSPEVSMPTSSPTSKVTINTRPLSSQSMANNAVSSADGNVDDADPPGPADDPSTSLPEASPSTGVPAATHETISISSSRTGSPEIEIAEVEDYDQEPSETKWTRRIGGSSATRSIQPFHVHTSFPLASEYKLGEARQAIARITKVFADPLRDPGAVFQAVKDWLVNFAATCEVLTEAMVEEESAFWSKLHLIPEALLRRDQQTAASVRCQDLIDFFLAYGQVTKLMLEFETRRCVSFAADAATAEKAITGVSWSYLLPLTWVLTRDCTLLTSLQKYHGLDTMLIIKPCCNQLMDPKNIDLMQSVSDLVSALALALPKSTKGLKDFSPITNSLSNLVNLLAPVPGSFSPVESDTFGAVESIRTGVENALSGLDKLLQDSIKKQCTWLNMETGPELINKICPMISKFGALVPRFGKETILAASVDFDEEDYTLLELIVAHAWRFMMCHKFLRHGRMELRVYGVDRMCSDLVEVFRRRIRDRMDGQQDPLVRFLNRFLRENDIIPYVISVDSHPQILQRSANLVGFLSVSRTYTTSDTDIIWRAVVEGQDPRTVHEVLALLQRCFDPFYTEDMNHVCQKLVELPLQRFDARILDFALAAFAALRSKAPHSHFFGLPSYQPVTRKLCLRLLRIVSAPASSLEYWYQFQADLRTFLTTFLQPSREPNRCLAIDEDEELELLSEIRADIASHGDASCGAILIINEIFSMKELGTEAALSIADRCEFPRLLVDDIAELSTKCSAEMNPYDLTQFDCRLTCLSFLLNVIPDKFDHALLSVLWIVLLTGRSVPPQVRARTWERLTMLMKHCTRPNAAIDQILRDFWPSLQPSEFSKAVLDFAEQSISYESEISDHTMPASDAVIVIPGIERVWSIMLNCPPGSLETEATDFVINQYLRNQLIKSASKAAVRATHLDLIDRCVNLVLGSAARLKSFAESDTSSDGDEGMVIIATQNEIRIEESRFDRSLLFLRRFTEAIKGNPGCSPISSRQLDGLPEFPGKKGDSIDLKVQVFGNKYVTDAQRSISVGSANTGSELWTYLSNVSGFSSFAIFNDGKARTTLQEETSTLEELKITRGALIVNKTPQTVEQMPATRLRSCSPVDEKIMLHFDDLYGLLESDNRLAKEVYDFLNITTVREKVSQLAKSMEMPASDLLPSDMPYKLLFCTQALRSPVELDSFSATPDPQFLSYAVEAITTALSKLGQGGFSATLQKTIAYELLDTLLIAFRAKISDEVSRLYLSSHEHFAGTILRYLDSILKANDSEMDQLQPEKMARASFEVLLELRLQNESSWKALDSDPTFSEVLGRALLSDHREKVRQSMLDVLLGLIGSTGGKINLKAFDPRAPRARYDSLAIESCLTRVWGLLLEILPNTNSHKTRCQEFFDAMLVVLRRIGKSFETVALQSLFEQWSEALLKHDHDEIVGQPMRDRFTLGATKIIFECAKILRARNTLTPQPKLMRRIITKFLFPPLSESHPETLDQSPILDSGVRDSLYELLALMCQTPAEVDAMASELSNDLVSPDIFEPNMTHERLALRTEVGYAGLRNLSNTCYLNSLFSQLFMNVQFRELVLTTTIVDERRQKLIWEMAKVFAHMQNSYEKSVEPSAAVDSIITYDGENIDVTVQMDVDEFFNLLFERLEGQIADQDTKLHFKSLYGGQTIQQIKSKECDHVSERPEAFAVLPVEIKEKIRLEDSLKAYVEGELLQGDNKYSCTSCGRLVDAVKRSCLKEVPDNLIFNLKRFDYDIMTGLRCKLNDHFQFPDVLDMAPYTLDHLSQPEQPFKSDPFELTGIIVHSGTADSGHYFSYIRQRPSARAKQHSWVQFNDADVTPFDPIHIQDMCFGGVDVTWNNLPKFYNAYMLFYQRTSSIQETEQRYMHTDQLNPLRLMIPPLVDDHIAKENELFLRSYCAQDPVHARFVRQLLERLWDTGPGLCSEAHDVENRTLGLALDYMQNISSRWKGQSEMEASSKLVNKYSRRCTICATSILQWFTGDRILMESVVKSPYQASRKTFSHMLRTCLTVVHAAASEQPGAEVAQIYQSSLRLLLSHLGRAWDFVARTARVWPEYFHLLSEIVDLGVEEARLVVEMGFFECGLGLIQVHYIDSHDFRVDRKLRSRYASYLNARERNRPFNHAALITFFARMLFRFDLNSWPEGPGRVMREGSNLVGLAASEIEILGLHQIPHDFDWLKRIVAGKAAPAVADQIVGWLAGERQLAGAVSDMIARGLEHKSMPVAAAFLQPLIAFCSHCGSTNQITDLVVRFAESVPTIGLEYGKDYFVTIYNLLRIDNKTLGENSGFLVEVLAEQIHHWAPVLLVAGSDMTADVRGETLNMVNALLLEPMDTAQDEDPSLYRVYQSRAQQLAKLAADYVRTAFLNANSSESHILQPGHAQQVTQAVERCLASAELDNVEDEQRVEEIQRILADLKGRADQAVETLSTAEWQESSEMDALSEDFEDLVSP